MLNFLKKLPIKTQLMTLAVSTGIIMLVIISVAYFQIARTVRDNNSEYTGEMTFQIKNYINSNLELIEKLLNNVAYNTAVQKFMIENRKYENFKLHKEVDNLCLNLQEIMDGIVDVYIMGDTGSYYELKGHIKQVSAIVNSIPKDAKFYYTGNYKVEFREISTDCFVIATTVNSINPEIVVGEKIGIVAIVIDKKLLSFETNKKYTESATKFYLIDRNNNIYASNDKNMDESILNTIKNYPVNNSADSIVKNGKKKYVIHCENIEKIGGRIISIIPEEELFKDIVSMRKTTVLIFVFAIGLLSIPFSVITNNILYPLRTFMKYIKSLKSGNLKELKQRLRLEGYEEIEITAKEFNSLLDEIDSLTHRLVSTSTRLYEAELEKKRAELGYLRSQINPHFLYNTLEVMKGCAIDENAHKTFDVAKSLGRIFRYSVKGADIVLLQEEMEIIKSYIQIQQVRFNERFKVSYEFNDDALKCSIPKMILQPIVENAVFHGLESKLGEGCLYMGGRIDAYGDLNIWIKDDGVGMNKDTLYKITQKLYASDKSNEQMTDENISIGIINVNNRIRLTYGEQYGISITSTDGQGTEVIIKIPARRDEFV